MKKILHLTLLSSTFALSTQGISSQPFVREALDPVTMKNVHTVGKDIYNFGKNLSKVNYNKKEDVINIFKSEHTYTTLAKILDGVSKLLRNFDDEIAATGNKKCISCWNCCRTSLSISHSVTDTAHLVSQKAPWLRKLLKNQDSERQKLILEALAQEGVNYDNLQDIIDALKDVGFDVKDALKDH